MDLYQITYVRKKDGVIDPKSPEYHLLVRTNIDPNALEKIARPWFLTQDIHLDELFLLKAVPLMKGGRLNQDYYQSGMIPSQDYPLFV